MIPAKVSAFLQRGIPLQRHWVDADESGYTLEKSPCRVCVEFMGSAVYQNSLALCWCKSCDVKIRRPEILERNLWTDAKQAILIAATAIA
ncbi:MAG: hypothetical protein ACYC5H_16085 [Methylovirgula sp.]